MKTYNLKPASALIQVIGLLFLLASAPAAFSADLFDESETQELSLDERIKALENEVKIGGAELNQEAKANPEESYQMFESSISGKLDASTLESEVQDLKQDIIELNKELAILEQDILTPVSSQATLFLSIDKGHFFKLDALKLEVDGKVVEHHLYTKQEVNALTKGAIQKVHTANLAPGNHELVVIMSGYSIDGRDVKKAANYKFYKPNSKKYIELSIQDNVEEQKTEFKFSEWQ